jgi:hypothetical protein
MFVVTMPFTHDLFFDLVKGKEIVLARNRQPSNFVSRYAHIKFDDTSFTGDLSGKWYLDNGEVVLTDEWQKPSWIFRGMETRNGTVFLTGEPLMDAHHSGFERMVMYEYLSLGSEFRICISSHVDYTEALKKLLRSLERIGFPKDRVAVVVGGAEKETSELIDGWWTNSVKQNYDGFTALSALPQDWKAYWLLLHDTCEVNDDFIATIGKLDIGLNFDAVFSSPSPCEIGLYSAEFVKLLNGFETIPGKKAGLLERVIIPQARLWSGYNVEPRKAMTKDVYGTGNKRDVFYFDSIGVKKYRRATGAAAKP